MTLLRIVSGFALVWSTLYYHLMSSQKGIFVHGLRVHDV